VLNIPDSKKDWVASVRRSGEFPDSIPEQVLMNRLTAGILAVRISEEHAGTAAWQASFAGNYCSGSAGISRSERLNREIRTGSLLNSGEEVDCCRI